MTLRTTLHGPHDALPSPTAALERAGPRSAPLERVAARQALAELPLSALREAPALPYDDDALTRLHHDTLDEEAWASVAGLSVGALREHLLAAPPAALHTLAPGLPPEVAAAVARLMTPLELALLAARVELPRQARGTVGLRGTLAAALTLEAGPPATLEAAAREALAWGCGDALLSAQATGAAEAAEALRALDGLRRALDAPTQVGVWAPLAAQLLALESGAPADLLLHPLVGSAAGLEALGASVGLLDEAQATLAELVRAEGPHRLVFTTGGPGQSLCDEARALGLARRYRPLLVLSAAGQGLPGPASLRAALEAQAVGRLLGLPMGAAVALPYPLHQDPETLELGALLLLAAGPAALALEGPGTVGLSPPDLCALRQLAGLQATPELAAWAEERGLLWGHTPGPRLGELEALGG